MGLYILVNGRTNREMGTVSSNGLTDQFMKATGEIIKRMAMEDSFMLMEMHT